MEKDNFQNIILNHIDVENKIKRISLEIQEDNIDLKELFFFGVSVNRDHSLFPVKIDFSGLNLSTSVNERVNVKVNKKGKFTVYLN